MHSLKDIVNTKRSFFICLLLFCILGICLNDVLYIPLDEQHPVWLNIFFINYTFMGDGLFVIALALLYFFYFNQKRTGLVFLFAFLFSESVIQLIKNFLSHERFQLFFEKGQYLFFTNESELANYYSFPSGHTAVAFAIATVFILKTRDKKWVWAFFPAAILLGVSRMYLAQHSLAEIISGAFIGAASGLASFYLVYSGSKIKFRIKKLRRPQNVSGAFTINTQY